MSRIGAYLANGLVPGDPRVTLGPHRRDPTQARYELAYREAAPSTAAAAPVRTTALPTVAAPPHTWSPAVHTWLGAAAVPVLAGLVLLRRRRVASAPRPG